MVSKIGTGAVSGVVTVKTSIAPENDFSCRAPFGPPCRWGDYATASADPVASVTGHGRVWLANEWSHKGANQNDVDWLTWIWHANP